MSMRFRPSFNGPDPLALATALLESGLGSWDLPTRVRVDGEVVEPSRDWLKRHGAPNATIYANFGPSDFMVMNDSVKAECAMPDLSTTEILDRIAPMPFTVGSLGSLHDSWFDAEPPYEPPGTEHGLWMNGWAVVLKGHGHRQLVSRRWLENGPWKLHAAPDDVTFVEFHERDADPQAALAAARDAHQRFGLHNRGGYIPTDYEPERSVDALYESGKRQLTIVVHGRSVSEAEMLEVCAARLFQSEERPIDHVAYVFAEATAARRHQRALWLRDLGCYTFVEGELTQLEGAG